jgi:hypothetical protein
VNNMTESESTLSVKDLCEFGGSLGFSVDNALTLAIITQHGHEVAEDIQFRVLRSHQKHLFLGGLKKLGLDTGFTDPVRCAKFHVLSNYLGGLNVRYGEGDGKAWVVYDTPYWMDSPWSPGISPVAIRPEHLYRTMEAWHANNGVMLGNPRLGYAQTQLVARGDACDAGYFFEADKDLAPEERMQLRFEEGLPADLQLDPPLLDEKIWPIERQAKAWRNFSVAYVGGRIYWVIEVLGEAIAVSLLEHCLRITMLQNRDRLKLLCGINGASSPQRAAAIFTAWHEAWGDEIEIKHHADSSVECTITRSRLHEAGEFSAPADPLPIALEAAINRAWKTVIEYDCPNVAVVANGSMQDQNALWSTLFNLKE